MNFFTHLFKKIKTQKTAENNKNITKVNSNLDIHKFKFEINSCLLPLLYFTDGPYRNIDSDVHEPSAISIQLPLSKEAPNKLGYYPSYSGCTPAQRYAYLNWLTTNLDYIPDIGYAFILLDCLERHIVNNDEHTQLAAKIIAKLQQTTDNKSFAYYSTSALAYNVIKYNTQDLLENIDINKCSPKFKALLKEKFTATDLIQFANLVGFNNKRYIKSYPDLYLKSLQKVLKQDYGKEYFTYIFSLENTNSLSKTIVLFSNSSINTKLALQEIDYSTPDPFSDINFSSAIKNELQKAHDTVKQILRQQRKTNSNSKPTVHTKTTKKRINSKTGYPMSTDKQIQKARELVDLKFTKAKNWEDKQLNYILPLFHQGLLNYRLGEWNKAESNWLPLVYLMPHAVDKLCIMYRKEKRYKDVIFILKEANKSKIIPKLYGGQELESIDNAKKTYEKHKSIDNSKLTLEKFKEYKGYPSKEFTLEK